MFHQSSKQILLGIFVALLLITVPVYAVKSLKISNYGGGHQIWFEVEDFDERDPADDSSFALSDEPGAFGRSISSVSGTDGASMIRYTFDISKAGGNGGTWYFWGRVINPNNNSDFMLVDGHPGDQVPFTLPVSGLVNGQRIFEQSGLGTDWVWAPTASSAGEEAHTKTLKDGENTMYILARESGAIWDVFMWTDSPDYVPTDEDYINAVIPLPGAASNPSPTNEATDVPREVVLSWMPGEFAPPVNGHTVYFSESFDDVNAGIGGVTQSATSYTPSPRLDFEKTYYWRVDEVNGPPDFTIFKGQVWQFTVEPFAYPVAGTSITATASSQFNENQGPENTINGSGLDADDLHSTEEADIWLSSMTGPQPTWIQYEFDQVYKLHEMWVWNFNQTIELVVGFGLKEVTIEYSTNGTDWAVLADVPEFARALGAAGYAYNTTVDLGGVVAKYVKITANSNWGGIIPQYGLSEVRFFYIPVVAREPDPASGTTDVGLDNVTLSWRRGRETASHEVYFSTKPRAVINDTALVATISENSYDTGPLELGQTYYWKVNEVNEAETPATWQGDVWNFTTQEYFVVDDFEDYNDLEPDRIFDTWLDGWNVPTNGSQVGYAEPPFAEQSIVHGGKQSMPFSYDNTGGVAYSEAERTFAAPQDWTVKGVKALTLWFKGNPEAFQESPPGTFTISADGVDIWGTADEFRYVYKQLSGDGSIIAQVLSLEQNDDPWAKAGVMIRDTLDADSSNAFAAITGGEGDGATFQWRPNKGSSSSSSRTLVGISPPASVKLVRQGNIFTGYVFLDGQWQQEGESATVPMADPVYIGLALTSHSSGVICVAKFSDVSTTGTVTGPWQVAEIGAAAHPANTAAPLYVALADSANKTATVKHPDAAATTINAWTEWNIDLAEFTGVNLKAINKMIIGVGDKANPQSAAGSLYFDDILLYPSRCLPEIVKPAADLNNDCQVNSLDLEILASEWLIEQVNAVDIAEVFREAEAADTITDPLQIWDRADASGGQYIEVVPGNGSGSNPPVDGHATYVFDVKGGVYKIIGRVIAPSGSDDSFWVRIQGATTQTTNHASGWVRWGVDNGSNWHWAEVQSMDDDGQTVQFTMPAGTYTMELAYREDGTLLDAFLITDNLDIDQRALLPDGVSSDLNDDKKVDSKDYAILADMWLKEQLWP